MALPISGKVSRIVDGGIAKWSKATVCKTVIHRFESGSRLQNTTVTLAGMAKLAYARDLKSCVPKGTCGFDSHSRHGLRRAEGRSTERKGRCR